MGREAPWPEALGLPSQGENDSMICFLGSLLPTVGAHPGFLSLHSRWSHSHQTATGAEWRIWDGDRSKGKAPWPSGRAAVLQKPMCEGRRGPWGLHMLLQWPGGVWRDGARVLSPRERPQVLPPARVRGGPAILFLQLLVAFPSIGSWSH